MYWILIIHKIIKQLSSQNTPSGLHNGINLIQIANKFTSQHFFTKLNLQTELPI